MITGNWRRRKITVRSDTGMEKSKGIPIFVFLSILILGTVLGSGLIFHYMTTIRNRALFGEELKNGIEMLAGSAQIRLTPLLVFGSYEDVNDVVVDTFSRNANIEDVFIVMKDTKKIYYDLGGDREGSLFSDKIKDGQLEYYSLDIKPPGGMGIVVPLEGPAAELVVGYRVTDLMSSQQMNALLDYAYSIFNEISSLQDTDQTGQARVLLNNIMISNENITSVQLIDDRGMVFSNPFRDRDGSICQGPAGMAKECIQRNMKRISVKKPILLNRTTCGKGEPIVEIYISMLRKGRVTGTIYIEYNISGLLAAEKNSRRLLTAAAVLFALAGLAGALATSFWIAKPIGRLASVVEKSEVNGTYEKIGSGSAAREIRSLVSAYNRMIARRGEAERALTLSERNLRELSLQVIAAHEDERERLGRELHDEFGQKFLLLTLKIEALRKKGLVSDGDIAPVEELLQETAGELMRIYKGLKPTVITRLGLSAALESLAREAGSQDGLTVETEITPVGKDEIEFQSALRIFRIAQESLTNIIKHAGAKRVRIELRKDENRLMLRIEDDGRGMEADSETGDCGIGLTSMRERARAMNGHIEIGPRAGGGTVVALTVLLNRGNQGAG